MIKSKIALLGFVAISTLGSFHARAADITGAGSSFAAPIYGAWGQAARNRIGVTVNYQSVGSSAGQDQVVARTVDFGASDKPMAADRLAREQLFQFPTVMSGIVVVVNVPGIAPGSLHLDGQTIAALFDGDITTWNDERLKALNPGVNLPETDVAPIHRADGSGTSFVFTSYLSQVSPPWKQKLGAGTSIAWPGGSGARGNDGVAAMVKQTEGGIGYVEYAYAEQNHLNIAQIRNHAGQFVSPSLDGFAEAAQAASWNTASHYAVNLLDTTGFHAWPIVTATFVLVPVHPVHAETAEAVHTFFMFGFEHGDADNKRLGYVGLPNTVKNDILSHWPK